MRPTPVHVWQDSDKRVTFSVTERTSSGERPYDLTGGVLSFYQKAGPEASDGAALYTLGSGITLLNPPPLDEDGDPIEGGTEQNTFVVETDRTNHQTVGVFWYSVRFVKGSVDEVLFAGPLIVHDS